MPTDEINESPGPTTGIRLFLDSANPSDWKSFLPLGMFHGVTTNPLLLERADQQCTLENLKVLTATAADLGAKEIQLQTWGDSVERMVETGRELHGIAPAGLRPVIKIPATTAGFQVASILRDEDLAVTMTAVYTPGQVMAAAGLGAAYAAPYLGRLDDAGQDGRGTVLDMHGILAGTRSPMRLLAASLRTAEQVAELAAAGLDTFTFGAEVAAELLASDLTDAAATDFQRAARAMGDQS